MRQKVASGIDPTEERRAERAKVTAAAPEVLTFAAAAAAFLPWKQDQLKNENHRRQWKHSLDVYAASLASLPVETVTPRDVVAAVAPIWNEVPVMARKVVHRIGAVLDYAEVQQWTKPRDRELWRAQIASGLGKQVTLVNGMARGHQRALPYEDVPAFVVKVRALGTIPAKALEFTILTAVRTGETLGARWSEIDLDGAVWTIPAARMKMQREHRVPLSDRAVEILREMAATGNGDDLVFPGKRGGRGLSNMAMLMVCRRLGVDTSVHGFRSSFRDWAGDCTPYPADVAEAALAHKVRDKVEAAYRRRDAFDKRRALMADWGAYCQPKAGNVVALRAAQ